jgi:hypothetical protein
LLYTNFEQLEKQKKNKKMICEELQNFEQNKSEKFAENGQGAV